MHHKENPDIHDHIYFFLDDKVFRYYNQTLEEGYPKEIQEEFPGVPTHLDAAVECPSGECTTDSVLFFKGHDVHVYDIATKTVKTKTWSHLPVCTSALRWLESHYCFHGMLQWSVPVASALPTQFCSLRVMMCMFMILPQRQ
ncbi:hemopexin repeat-containing protein [Hafnia paralvei]|uniref:hemopexin repeat-containing protein n=1 Tax=Hafnia paralvei TaxID=546367 RepID=UPI003F73F983